MNYTIGEIATTADEDGMLVQVDYTASATVDGINVSTPVTIFFRHIEMPDGDGLQALCEATEEHERVGYILYAQAQAKKAQSTISDDAKKALWMSQVDTNAANVYAKFTRFDVEYEQREAAAQAYKDAGYTDDPTIWLTAFADSNGISYQACADLVLSQAANLRAAVQQLGALRMDKYKIKNATTIADAEVAFNTIIYGIAYLDKSIS